MTKQPGIGHNSVSGDRIKAFIDRIEKLEVEKKSAIDDIKEVYSEAKSQGFETKIIRKLIAIRKANLEKRREEAELLELYASAIQLDLGF